MSPLHPHVSEAGAGPAVVCLHGNAASCSQWRALAARLCADHHVIAPDLLGAGRSPAWPAGRPLALSDEIDFLAPVFARIEGPVFLVGHSYGAALALLWALRQPPQRLAGLAIYEPTLFAWLEQESSCRPALNGVRCATADAVAAVARGDRCAATEGYVDYWMGLGSWRRMPAARRELIAASIGNVEQWVRALFAEPTPLAEFRSLGVPVLSMTGGHSPASSRGVARLLEGVLPDVTRLEFDVLGHMGPVTHPELVNDAVAEFVRRCATRSPRDPVARS